MLRALSSLVAMTSLLLSAAANAEDAKPETIRITSSTDLVIPIDSLYSSDWRYELDDLEFQDNSALGRISRVRELSLLTLAETRRSRFFLGVNSDGIFGLHFNAR